MSDIVERLRMKVVGQYLGHGQYEAVDLTPLATEAADEITRLRSLLKEAGEALETFSHYSAIRSAKPLLGLGDIIHGVHHGSEWEANIKLSDCDNARTVLSKIKGEA
jgi:hypothetical protein